MTDASRERGPAGDVAVLGAGLIGLSIAFELAERGATVRVFDTREPARAASWAAAGMLAPFTEEIEDAALRTLCEDSLDAYPAFVERVRAASGVDPHLRLDGVLSAAYTAAGQAALTVRADELRGQGRACDLYGREATLGLEPALGKHVAGSLLVRGEGQIDNRRLGRALLAACERRGVLLRTGLRSLAIEADARRVLGVRSDAGFVPVRAVVNACGAWAGRLEGVPPDCIVPVEPVKGQMLALAIPAGFVRRTTWVPGAYVVPREDGRLLAGATVERVGFDTRVTAEGLYSLLSAVLAAAPALGSFTVTETWAGLRPGTPDERPYLGATLLDGYYLATGHYRNGILLAPATARLLADALEAGEHGPLAPFSLERSSTKSAVS